jgi:HEXXH motif-containing protein
MAMAADAAGCRAEALVEDVLGTDDKLLPLLACLGPVRRARLFRNSLAQLDTATQTATELADPRSQPARARAILRHLLGHADGPDLTLVLPPGALPPGGLTLPHIAAVLIAHPFWPIALRQDSRCLRIVRGDGVSLTLPRGMALPSNFTHPLVISLPRVAGFTLLNDAPEVAATFASFGFAQRLERKKALANFSAGVALLRSIWPAAHSALVRHVDSVVLLTPRGFERSHTPGTLRGTVLLTAGTPQAVGDLLCHEASHLRMMPFLDRDDLIATDPALDRAGFISPWRPDRRPLRGILLGVHAFLNVCRFHRLLFDDLAMGTSARAIFTRQHKKVLAGLETLRRHGRPTALGAALITEFEVATTWT